MNEAAKTLIDSGISGIIIVALAWVVIYLYRRQDRKQDIIESELRELRHRFDKYLEEDREEMLQTIRENTSACNDLHAIIRAAHES